MEGVAQNSTLALPAPRQCSVDKWTKFTVFLTVGYLFAGRSFAYIGLPWLHVYLGEIALGALLVRGPMTKQGRWLCIAKFAGGLRRFERLLILLLVYGVFEALRGMLLDYPTLTAVRDTAFNYYPIFLYLGVWAGLRDKGLLRRAIRVLAWWNGCYGLAWVLFLGRMPWTMIGTASAASPVPLFSEPLGAAVSLIGLFALEPKLKPVWHLLVLNAIVLLGVQAREDWLSFAVGLLVLAWCKNRFKEVAIGSAVVIALLGIMFITNVNLPSPRGRGGRIQLKSLLARGLAPLNRNLADELAPTSATDVFAGTVTWRLMWWASIWDGVHANTAHALLGFGYGFPIGDLNPDIKDGSFIQTPHNDFFYALGFSGWLGVLIFILLQMELLRLLRRSYRITGQPFGLACWAVLFIEAMLGDFFEAPMGAIPFYLLIGAALAPALLRVKSGARENGVCPHGQAFNGASPIHWTNPPKQNDI